MWFRRERKLGDRLLKFGCRGPDVADLQQVLSQLGFDPGPSDGHYGWLTEAAVRDLQREYRLLVDGKAGPQVYGLLQALKQQGRRTVYNCEPGEDLASVVERLGVSREALLADNLTLRRGVNGQVVVRRWHVLAALPGVYEEDELPSSIAANRTAISALCVGLEPKQVPELNSDWPSLLPFPVLEDGTPLGEWRRRLRHRARREALDLLWPLIGDTEHRFAGLYLDFSSIERGDVGYAAAFLKQLRREIDQANGLLAVRLSMRLWRLRRYCLDGLAKLLSVPDLVVLPGSAPSEWLEFPGPPLQVESLSRMLHTVQDDLPLWKTVVALPLQACEVRLIRRRSSVTYSQPRFDSYQRALTEARRMRRQMVLDEQSRMYVYGVRGRDEQRLVWLDSRQSASAKIRLVRREALAGVLLEGLGGEAPFWWHLIRQSLPPVRYAGKAGM